MGDERIGAQGGDLLESPAKVVLVQSADDWLGVGHARLLGSIDGSR
jgi:hypothetical protein